MTFPLSTSFGPQPSDPGYPKGWEVYRDSERGYDDEYHPLDSWVANKVMESDAGVPGRNSWMWGVRGTYEHKLRLTVRVRIYGKRKTGGPLLGRGPGRLRAHRWYASVEFGDFDTRFSLDGPSGKCSSVADAVRKADADPAVTEMVKRAIVAMYTDRTRVVAYFRVTSNEPRWGDPPAHPPSCEEYFAAIGPLFGPFDFLPEGRYVAFSWCRTFKAGETGWRKMIRLVTNGGGGGASSCSPAEHERWEGLFPEWLTQPAGDYRR